MVKSTGLKKCILTSSNRQAAFRGPSSQVSVRISLDAPASIIVDMMSSPIFLRLVPATSRFAARQIFSAGRPSIKAQTCQWKAGARRPFSARSACTFNTRALDTELTATLVNVKKYTEDHEWIELDADGKIGTSAHRLPTFPFVARAHSHDTGTIGITEYAANALGDVVYVELPEIGLEVAKGDTMGAVESVKSASDIMTPVSGKITEHNTVLEEKPGTVNKSPEDEGWMAKIEVSDVSELDSLMSKEEYDSFEKE